MTDECTAVKEAKKHMRLKKKHVRRMGTNLKDHEEKPTKQQTLDMERGCE